MKRILLLFSALMLSCIALWAHDVQIDGIYYNLDETNKTAEITYCGDYHNDYDGEYSGSVTIPETITYNSIYSVTSIGSSAFRDCSGLTSVTIPNSVTSIGEDAFYGTGFYNSESNWDNGVLYIDNCLIDAKSDVVKGSYTIKEGTRLTGEAAFSGCSGLTSVTIPNSVTSIGDYAFYGCSGLTEVTIPNSVTSIGYRAFSGCSGLTSVTIPNNVTSIGDYAFSGCSGLTSVTIPNSVTSIGKDAFNSCSGLTSVTIGESVTSIGEDAFEGCSGLTSVIWNAKNCEDFKYDGFIEKYTSPFYNIRSNITSFTFGNEVEHIPAYLCYGMENLKEVTIGNSVTSIGYNAFSDCSGLTKVNYLGTVDKWVEIDFDFYVSNPTYYAKDLYINNELLTDVKITTADSIKKYAFHNCQSIKSVEIGNSVTYIDQYAFYGTGFYNNNSNWDNGVLYIDNCLIDAKSDVVKGSYTIKKGTRIIGEDAFYNCSGLTSVTIPNSVTVIDEDAFSGCSGLTSVIWNAKHCKDFEYDSYFRKCTSPFYNIRSNITSFTFGNEVEHIPAFLCYGMSKLTEMTIPKNVVSIGTSALYCSGLTKVNYLGTVDKWVDIDWKYSDSNPTYYAKDLYINNELLTDVKITTADSIKKYAFYNCQSIKSVEIGNSVTSIDQYAFYGCSGLTSVIWNAKNCEDFTSYSSSPFYNIRSNITSFTFGNEVEHIPAYLCYGISKLTEMTIPNSVTSIGSSAFSGCSGLTSVTIGNSVTSIGEDAFYNCSGLTKVNYLGIVDKWVEIDFEYSYSNPTKYAKDLYINNELLTDVKITTADSIKFAAFYNCQSIKSVEIGESVTSIGSSAFYGCDKLRKVTAYPTTVPNVYENSFAHYNAALYVPCDVYDDYFFDDVFGTFKVTECIAAEEVDAPDKVEIEVDEDNNANVIWPSTDGAKKYELEISKDGEVFCTLLFNENGQLTSIDFGNRSASVGFQFTVTGLDGASKYAYSMVAMDKKGNELQSYKGTFTTNGYVPGPGEEDEPVSITETLADANITVSGGTISADADFSIYNTIGQDVTAFNGSLQPGVYLVSIENNIVKVMVK